LDIWVEPAAENARRCFEALVAFGAPVSDLTVEDMAQPKTVFQIGIPPVRIDIMSSIDGVDFRPAWEHRVKAQWGDVSVPVISLEHLIRNKEATGREMDRLQAERLRKYGRQP
jgi:hypothetical protein